MDREVRYCTTTDGVRIAYFASGRGPTLLLTNTYGNETWAAAEFTAAERFVTVVHYHARGLGLSDRDPADRSLAARCLDIEAVLVHMGCARAYVLNTDAWASILALAFAGGYPQRVERMALMNAVTSMPRDVFERVNNLMRAFPDDLRSVYEAHVRSFNAWEANEVSVREVVRHLTESMSVQEFAELWEDVSDWDVRGILPNIVVPTLVVYARDSRFLAEGREIMSRLPHGRMVVADGESEAIGAVVSFLAEDDSARGAVISARRASGAEPGQDSGTAIILFTDIVDSTRLTERMGDEAFRAKVRTLDETLRNAVRDHGGAVIDAKTLGDGILATFPAASQAIAAALACGAAGEAQGLPLHLGLHAGDVIREEGNVFGGAVNLASRISGLSAAGEVLVSRTVRDLARTSAGVEFEDRGEHQLKGIAEAVRVYAVRKDDG